MPSKIGSFLVVIDCLMRDYCAAFCFAVISGRFPAIGHWFGYELAQYIRLGTGWFQGHGASYPGEKGRAFTVLGFEMTVFFSVPK